MVAEAGCAGEDLEEQDEVEGGFVRGVDAVEDDFFLAEQRAEGVGGGVEGGEDAGLFVEADDFVGDADDADREVAWSAGRTSAWQPAQREHLHGDLLVCGDAENSVVFQQATVFAHLEVPRQLAPQKLLLCLGPTIERLAPVRAQLRNHVLRELPHLRAFPLLQLENQLVLPRVLLQETGVVLARLVRRRLARLEAAEVCVTGPYLFSPPCSRGPAQWFPPAA